MADLARVALALRLLPAVATLSLLSLGQASAAGADKRMTAYFNCIDRYADPAIRKLVTVRGLLTDGEILGEVAKAEGHCQKQTAAAVEAVRETPKNGAQDMTDEQIRAQLRSMSATGYVMTYGQQ
ncbi:MAG TPA: hypothetical protein VE872_00510 [Candidatus Bathyarchaeia archaeon]|nr:hypothetical protein [Candidatus Bathyarchaeia archaeon]